MSKQHIEHEPSPWYCKENTQRLLGDCPVFEIWSTGRYVCTVDSSGDDNEANARLIAAAPELYEALELAHLALSGSNMDMKVVERKVQAALAKAKGE